MPFLQAEKHRVEAEAAAQAAEHEALDKEARSLAAEVEYRQRQHVIQESPELKALKQLIDVLLLFMPISVIAASLKKSMS